MKSAKRMISIPAQQAMQKNGFFVKNYAQKQIIIDRNNFNPDAAYNLAGKVYWKNFVHKYKIAPGIKDDHGRVRGGFLGEIRCD